MKIEISNNTEDLKKLSIDDLKKIKNEQLLFIQNTTVSKLENLRNEVINKLTEIEELEKIYENVLKVFQERT